MSRTPSIFRITTGLAVLLFVSCNRGGSPEDPPFPDEWGPAQSVTGAFLFPPAVTLLDSTTVAVNWRTSAISIGRVDFGVTTAYGSTVASPIASVQHHARLEGLLSATRYRYRVTLDGTGDFMDGTFTTPGLDRVRILCVGETHFATHASFVAAFSQTIRRFSPHLLVDSGDMVDDGTVFSDWTSYMQTSSPWLPNTLFLPCHSNHVNGSGGNAFLLDFVVLPDNERWYTTRYGPLLVLNLDSTFEQNADAADQEEWFRARIAEAHDGTDDPVFVLAAWHYPAFSSGPLSRETERTSVRSHFVDALTASEGVDVIHVGHDKFTERTVVSVFHHVQTDIGKLDPLLENPNPHKAYLNASIRSALLIEADGGARVLRGWIVLDTGVVVDRFEIRK